MGAPRSAHPSMYRLALLTSVMVWLLDDCSFTSL